MPLCPSRDQRLFALAGGAAPPSCDAGAYQTLATAALSVEAAQAQLSALFPDRDGDGIADVIDGDPALASLAFSDASSGGRMSGAIQTRGDQSLWLYDGFPNPQAGVVALALSSGGPTPARITACDGCVQFSVAAGEIKQVDCPASCVIADAGPDQIPRVRCRRPRHRAARRPRLARHQRRARHLRLVRPRDHVLEPRARDPHRQLPARHHDRHRDRV